jgi:hypothetical protein
MPLLNTADSVKMGTTQAAAVYQGSIKVWPPPALLAVAGQINFYINSVLTATANDGMQTLRLFGGDSGSMYIPATAFPVFNEIVEILSNYIALTESHNFIQLPVGLPIFNETVVIESNTIVTADGYVVSFFPDQGAGQFATESIEIPNNASSDSVTFTIT